MRRTFRAVLAVCVLPLALIQGCATITKGSSQPVTLHTDPDGAACDITREQKTVASVGATPGQVTVDRGWGAIDISCRKPGFQPTEARVDSEVQGWTFGNILIGGIIGFAVDAASGAMRQYPQFITLTLVPEEFASVAERDAYLVRTKARFDKEAAEAAELLRKNCATDACDKEAAALEAAKEKRLALLQEKVMAARIKQPASSRLDPGIDPLATRPARAVLGALR